MTLQHGVAKEGFDVLIGVLIMKIAAFTESKSPLDLERVQDTI